MKKNKNKSFLIINTFGIGDVIFSTPLLRNLKDNYPDAKIYYMGNKKTIPLLKTNPLIHRAFIYERDDFVKTQKESFFKGIKKYISFISDIRREKIDVVLDLSLNAPFGFFTMLAGIKKRVGLNYKKRSIFLTHKINIDGFNDKHVADYYLDVLKKIDINIKKYPLEIYPDEFSKDWLAHYLKNKGVTEKDLLIGVAPCGGDAFGKDATIKRWPEDNFIHLIKRLITEFGAKVFILAGPKEREEVNNIITNVNSESLIDFSFATLPQTVALTEKLSLFVGNDTGPLRFADGLNKKIVALFGPVDEKVYGPYPYDENRTIVLKKDINCRPCYSKFRLKKCDINKKCLADISVEEAFDATKKLLNK